MIAAMVLTNLLYLAGAIALATVISSALFLHHRRPKSLESSIEMFSRELKALQPEPPGSRPAVPGTSGRFVGSSAGDGRGPDTPSAGYARGATARQVPDPRSTGPGRERTIGTSGSNPRGIGDGVVALPRKPARAVTRVVPPPPAKNGAGLSAAAPGSEGAVASPPEQESEPG